MEPENPAVLIWLDDRDCYLAFNSEGLTPTGSTGVALAWAGPYQAAVQKVREDGLHEYSPRFLCVDAVLAANTL